VAAANLRRSQERILNARPMARQIVRVLGDLAARVDPSAHPLLRQPGEGDERTALMIVMTADKGMCGSFNASIIRAASNHIVEHADQAIALGVIGRRGRDYFVRRNYPIRFELVNFTRRPEYDHARAIAKEAIAAFSGREVNQVLLAYNEFKSVLQQRIVISQLLPIPKTRFDPGDRTATVDYIYEPSPQEIFDSLLERLVGFEIFTALVESAAAQNAAQMVAMDNATKNSGEVIDTLTLTMNKVRQAAITREIIEVVSGAGAL
jgi:F-type H+-transporting ATPase subunit gamma